MTNERWIEGEMMIDDDDDEAWGGEGSHARHAYMQTDLRCALPSAMPPPCACGASCFYAVRSPSDRPSSARRHRTNLPLN